MSNTARIEILMNLERLYELANRLHNEKRLLDQNPTLDALRHLAAGLAIVTAEVRDYTWDVK